MKFLVRYFIMPFVGAQGKFKIPWTRVERVKSKVGQCKHQGREKDGQS